MSSKVIFKDAFWQILGRIVSAIGGFFVLQLMTPYLGPLRFGDYNTIYKYFVIWSALADFGLYVIALKEIGKIKNSGGAKEDISAYYSKFVRSRIASVCIIFGITTLLAYLLPSYNSNPFISWGLPLGALFSGLFMISGIVQVPLQLYWKMEQVSIGLTIARVAQLLALAAVVFFVPDGKQLIAFLLVAGTIVLSGITQLIYTWRQSGKYLDLTYQLDWRFLINHFKNNRKYGLSYCISAFHTLATTIIFSIFFPTIQGFTYVGLRALALSLVEILLIIPSSIGNSIIHKVEHQNHEYKRAAFGWVLIIMLWFGLIVSMNFDLFGDNIIYLMGKKEYLAQFIGGRGSDTLLPFMGVMITLSFLKQVHNYLFISTDKQNKLLGVNIIGVIIGLAFATRAMPRYNLMGGMASQIIMETIYFGGAVYIARRNKVQLIIDYWVMFSCAVIVGFVWILGKTYLSVDYNDRVMFLVRCGVVNIVVLGASYIPMKQVFRGLGQSE